MAWEQRVSGRYYTRTYRQGGERIREYVGCGPRAEAIAAADAQARERYAMERAERRQERRRLDEADAQLAAFCRSVDAQIRQALTAGGYHHHRGEWRRKRDSTAPC